MKAICAATVLMSLATSRGGAQGIELELNLWVGALKSSPLHKLAEQKRRDLNSKDAQTRAEAAAFFWEVKAKRVILELLDSELHQNLVAEKYLDVIDFDCLSRLFTITFRDLPKSPTSDIADAKKIAARNKRVDAIIKQVARVLKVEPVPMKEYTQAALKESWLKMLQTAKDKRTLWKPVDETLERIKKDMEKDKKDEKLKYPPEEKKK